MNNFDLKKYLAEGKLLKEDANSIVSYYKKIKRMLKIILIKI